MTKQTIVFLERNTFNVPFRTPTFDHEWIDFGETSPDLAQLGRAIGMEVIVAERRCVAF